jgi:hypothetical protein
MSDTKHTKGEWRRFTNQATRRGEIFIENENGRTVAAISVQRDAEEERANARLIAAAPELLAVCEALRNVLPRYEPSPETLEIWAQSEAAIAKAKGDTP